METWLHINGHLLGIAIDMQHLLNGFLPCCARVKLHHLFLRKKQHFRFSQSYAAFSQKMTHRLPISFFYQHFDIILVFFGKSSLEYNSTLKLSLVAFRIVLADRFSSLFGR